jgi:hypothetical protein
MSRKKREEKVFKNSHDCCLDQDSEEKIILSTKSVESLVIFYSME